MRCRACRKQLSPYLDGELSDAQSKQIVAHLASCRSCATAHQRLEQAMQVVDQLPEIEPSAGFDAAFARKLRLAETTQQPAARRSWLLGSWRGPALVAVAAAGAVAAIALSVGRLQRPDLAAPPRSVATEIEIVRELDLLRDYEVVSNLDGLQDYEIVAGLDRLLDAAGKEQQ